MKMTSHVIICAILLIPAKIGYSFAQTAADIAGYDVPPLAQKIGPGVSRQPDEVRYNYVLPHDGAPNWHDVVCRETLRNGKLVERELFREGRLHGVQRKWFANGQISSEAPYRDGVQDGLFRQWDQQGHLVSEYQMISGTGIVRVYNSDGNLILEQPYSHNEKNGLCVNWMKLLDSISLVNYINSEFGNYGYSFFNDGTPAEIRVVIRAKDSSGFYVRYNKDGTIVSNRWYLHGQTVSEDIYSAAAAKDQHLPPYYADLNQCKKDIPSAVLSELHKYLNMPKVKIPLELVNGQAILAQ